MSDFQFDTFSILNSLISNEIVKEKALTTKFQNWKGWDGKMTADSEAALLIKRNSQRFS